MGFLNNWGEWLLGLPWIDIGVAVLIFILVFLFRKIFTKYLFRLILRLTNRIPRIFRNILTSFEKPLHFFIGILGIYLALLYLPIPWENMQVINTLYRSIIIIVLGWGFYNFAGTSSSLFYKIAKKMEDGKDSMLIPFLSRLLRFVIIALTLTIVAFELGYDVNGFIAGLGLGGLAFALAAQDTLSNFIGGIIIVTERPFKKGDWISTPTVEGIVEDISFRSTKVRAFEDSLVIIPNKTIAHEPITNWSLMNKRLITFTIGLERSVSRIQLETIVQRIKQMLNDHEDIDKELIIVNFNELKDSSYELYLYFFTKTTAWVEWTEVKQEMNLEIVKILEEEEVDIAYPSRSLYLESDSEVMEQVMDEVRNKQLQYVNGENTEKKD
ncbi:mechanosensitive ion channel family protein [Alteribacillus iranensis]|uniref:MscS family membrane protein n=1 Tax=Alteribacillus iranensis TaxID=930128 RepID=A0A1I2AGK4_9BACI|nr:mechanosensitive ion channel family protein [Alteribacillus iranensis]SFE43144.1 MscS family membrane protein [Alteribacillus iranensis]